MSQVQLAMHENCHQIAIVTLNRPEMRHAFNTEVAQTLLALFKQLHNSDEVRVVIITSSTDDAFCSGADLKERKGMTDEEWKQQHKLFEEMFETLAELKQPTIAAVNGFVLAGGFELALNCDCIIAGKGATFGLPEVTRGIMPGCGGARLLPKRVPIHIAKEWLFTGRMISAQEALQAGLLNKLVEQENVLIEAIKLGLQIAKNGPLGVQGVKKIADANTLQANQARMFEIQVYNEVIKSEDRFEGILAFNEKRQPQFRGK